MALTVGELAVRLEAETRQFKSELKRAERRIEGFERSTKKNIARAGKSFVGMLAPIAAVATAIVGLGAIRFGFQIAKGAIAAASSFEAYEVRLKALLGSQEGANKALEAFIKLSSATPFAVSQIVGGAATLATIVDGNRQELEELTLVAANLAATFGLGFEEAAGNLQRALASGFAAADLLNQRGVRQLIERVSGIPDLLKVPLARQRQAFKETFGRFGEFGTAAEDLSKTLGGALSNIGDAADNVRRALGLAIGPTVFAIAKGTIIPFFEDLQKSIEANEGSLREFTTRGIVKALEGLASFLDAGADTIDLLNKLKKQLEAAAEDLEIFAVAAAVGFAILNPILAATLLAAAGAATVVSNIDLDDVTDDVEGLGNKAETAADQVRGLADALRDSAERVGNLSDEFEKTRQDARGASDEAAAAARKAELERLAGIRRAEEAAAEFEAGDDVEFLAAQDQAIREKAEKEDAAREKAAAKQEKEDEKAREKSAKDVERAAKDAGLAFGDALEAGIEFGFVASQGAIDDFGHFLADTAGGLLSQALIDAIKESAEDGAGIFGDLFKSVEGDFFNFGSEQFAGALGTGLGLLGNLASNAFGSDSRISNEFVRSAVTGTENLRGIVAGPTNIPIAEVGESIERSQVAVVAQQRETNTILREIATLLAIVPVGQSGGVTSFDAMIASETISTPALG